MADTGEESDAWSFHKTGRPTANAFLDHKFQGEVAIEGSGSDRRFTASLTFANLILVETGERARLEAILDYIVGETDDHNIAVVPLTLIVAVIVSVFTQAFCFACLLFPVWSAIPLLEAGILTTGMGLWMIIVIARRRALFLGMRTAVVTTGLGLVPYIALALVLALFAG